MLPLQGEEGVWDGIWTPKALPWAVLYCTFGAMTGRHAFVEND
jgi:hypothetical protein